MSGDKRGNAQTRPTREEMAKAQRGVGPDRSAPVATIPPGFEEKIAAVETIEALGLLWETVVAEGFVDQARAMFSARKKALGGQ
jgi:hypothetical protein